MLSPGERQEIREFVHQELAGIEAEVRQHAGSYNYLCSLGGLTVFTHAPVGSVIHVIPHFD